MNEEFLTIPTELLQLLSAGQAWHYSIIPKSSGKNGMCFYIDETHAGNGIQDELEILFGKKIQLEPMPAEIIQRTLSKYYRQSDKRKNGKRVSRFDYASKDFLKDLISEANGIGCSDIHLEVYEERCRVRMRIDGKLVERYVIDKQEYPAIINKIKIKSNLDISEKRLPQDGRIFFTSDDEKFDIRVSVLPTLYGEKIVLRLLSKDATHIELESLGFSSLQLEEYLEAIKRPHGIMLISGPTGSGKTTTLYATLKILNTEHHNILTIEDPVEYTLEGINQVQLKESIGLTFASALRTFLRQDPDIIMLGEIRDGETAQMAIRAALTGHLVLSTIHTNSAWGTISRLIDMGIPPFLLASTMNLTMAQRLVRLLCPHCKTQTAFDKKVLPPHYKPPEKLETHSVAKGCEKCFYTGYKGRKAVYELIPITYDLETKIKKRELDITEYVREKQIVRLADAAFALFREGHTSAEEIYPILLNNI